jgi:hypothetical protein
MQTFIPGKDAALEDSISRFQTKLQALGFNIEEASWLNPVPHVWSVHIRDKDCPLCFTNGKGATQKAALASALGEYFERLSTNYFFADFFLGDEIANAPFVHYPNEKWFSVPEDGSFPAGMLDEFTLAYYNPQQSRMFGFPDVRAFTPDRWLEQGDRVRFGNVEMDRAYLLKVTAPGCETVTKKIKPRYDASSMLYLLFSQFPCLYNIIRYLKS